MPQADYCYFIANGRTLEAIKAYHAASKAHVDYMAALGKEINQPNLWQQDGRVVGFSGAIGSPIPAGLRRSGNKGMLVPNRRTPEGRVLHEKMKAAPPAPNRGQVMRSAGIDPALKFVDGRAYLPTCGWETIGERVIFITHAIDGVPLWGEPSDCERIPTSRYWLLKESSEDLPGMPPRSADGCPGWERK